MFRKNVAWKKDAVHDYRVSLELFLALAGVSFLAGGIILHAIFTSARVLMPNGQEWSLWILLIPAGFFAFLHITSIGVFNIVKKHVREQWPVWGKLMVIFSLLWILTNTFTNVPDILAFFFNWPFNLRYGFMIVLSLFSAVTDNVALASMQGTLMLSHPISILQVRIIFMLLTWAGGLTSFGCLQSLALNSFFKLSTKSWFKETPLWAILAIVGGFVGIAIIAILYPSNNSLLSMLH